MSNTIVWHPYGPDCLMSQDGTWRIYRRAIKDSDIFKYSLHRRVNGPNTGIYRKIAEGQTSRAMLQTAEDFSE